MVGSSSLPRMVFMICNYLLITFLALLCILPMIHMLAVSFSGSAPATAGLVNLWPVDFNLQSYQYVFNKPEFLHSFAVSCQRLALGVSLNILITILVAYPLSKENRVLRGRTLFVWVFVFTMLFSGGLIPTYLTVKTTGILDTIWALVLPNAAPIFLIILMINFFRNVPKELEEAAFMDGAGHWKTLWIIFVPLSLPSLATITLFASVGHWNAWFDGFLYMNRPEHFPLQTYLRSVIIEQDKELLDIHEWNNISDRTTRASQVIVGALPIIAVYPLLQRFFIKGMVMGSIKG